MNLRVLAVLLLLAAGLGAAWLSYSQASKDKSETPSAAGKPPLTGAGEPAADATVQPPVESNGTAPARTSAEEEDPAKPALDLEPVEALLELNMVAASASTEDSAESSTGMIDELLNGKHAGKDRAQLERSFRSVDAVLRMQSDPELIPKDQVLSPEAIRALEIEREWLKHRIVG